MFPHACVVFIAFGASVQKARTAADVCHGTLPQHAFLLRDSEGEQVCE